MHRTRSKRGTSLAGSIRLTRPSPPQRPEPGLRIGETGGVAHRGDHPGPHVAGDFDPSTDDGPKASTEQAAEGGHVIAPRPGDPAARSSHRSLPLLDRDTPADGTIHRTEEERRNHHRGNTSRASVTTTSTPYSTALGQGPKRVHARVHEQTSRIGAAIPAAQVARITQRLSAATPSHRRAGFVFQVVGPHHSAQP
jgi:hypothetical protein